LAGFFVLRRHTGKLASKGCRSKTKITRRVNLSFARIPPSGITSGASNPVGIFEADIPGSLLPRDVVEKQKLPEGLMS